jgi:hypothetical protein
VLSAYVQVVWSAAWQRAQPPEDSASTPRRSSARQFGPTTTRKPAFTTYRKLIEEFGR